MMTLRPLFSSSPYKVSTCLCWPVYTTIWGPHSHTYAKSAMGQGTPRNRIYNRMGPAIRKSRAHGPGGCYITHPGGSATTGPQYVEGPLVLSILTHERAAKLLS